MENRHVDQVSTNPRIDVDAIRKITYLHEFDRYVEFLLPVKKSTILTCNRALQCPTWGYPTEGAYYRDATSTDSMLAIRIPFLCVQAEDDPVSYENFPC